MRTASVERKTTEITAGCWEEAWFGLMPQALDWCEWSAVMVRVWSAPSHSAYVDSLTLIGPDRNMWWRTDDRAPCRRLMRTSANANANAATILLKILWYFLFCPNRPNRPMLLVFDWSQWSQRDDFDDSSHHISRAFCLFLFASCCQYMITLCGRYHKRKILNNNHYLMHSLH